MRITSMLSLVGVLSAGGAGAVVNNQVLTNTDHAGANAAVTVGATVNASATQVYSSVLTATQVMFQIGDAGLVTLDTAGNVLTVVSASTNPGWVIIDSTIDGQINGSTDGTGNGAADGSADVAVTFQSADDVLGFTADLLANGQVATNVAPNPSGVDDANGTADDEGSGTGVGGNGTDGTDGTDGDSGVDDANGTDDSADHCADGFIVVCADADADVQVNDD